ncbi:hypothetical protein [Micromonospora avicenniae]|nr:hypothetical protein [Micromonospora avicenniae]
MPGPPAPPPGPPVPPPPPPPGPTPAPPFPPPPATSWSPSASAGPVSTPADGSRTRSAPPSGGKPAGGRAGRYDGGPDLAGTVYGGDSTDGPGFTTIALPNNAVENSGSLTGHILAQGWADTPTPTERSRTTRVVIVLATSLGLLVVISVLLVLVAGDAVDGLIGNVLNS